jgi:OmpA-OmpF porin, OOP family
MHQDIASSTQPRGGLRFLSAVAATLLLATSAGVSAQNTRTGASGDGWSWMPGTTRGYVGLNVGRSEYNSSCGTALFGCDDPEARVHVYSGGMFNDWLGVELGYIYEGSADRGGGRQRAEGVNLSAVFKAPLGAFNVYGKVGGLYGRTRVTSALLSGIDGGERRGWGSALAVGAGYDITPRSGLVLEYSRNEFRFPGAGGRQNVDGLSLGYVHRF